MKLPHNSILGGFAALSVGFSLFISFRIAIDVLGSTQVGVWTLIQSIYIISRLPEMGIGVNLTRIVAIEHKKGLKFSIKPHLFATFVITIIPVLFIGLFIHIIAPIFIGSFFNEIISARTLFVLSLVAFGTTSVSALSAVLLSILEGFDRLAHRHVILIASNALITILAYPLIYHFGIIGLALSSFLANAAVLILVTIAMAKSRHGVVAPDSDVKAVVRQLWASNVQVSTIAITRMTFEPFTKWVIASFGNLPAVAYFDLALKLTTQTRVIVQMAAQPLLVLGARETSGYREPANQIFFRAQRLVVDTNIVLVCCQFLSAGAVSMLALGTLSESFILFYLVLATGNSINSLGIVGYFYDVSSGNFKNILLIHYRMALINLIGGLLGGWLFGAWAAILFYSLSFSFGGICLLRIWVQASGLNWIENLNLDRYKIILITGILFFVLISYMFRWTAEQRLAFVYLGLCVSAALIIKFINEISTSYKGRYL